MKPNWSPKTSQKQLKKIKFHKKSDLVLKGLLLDVQGLILEVPGPIFYIFDLKKLVHFPTLVLYIMISFSCPKSDGNYA